MFHCGDYVAYGSAGVCKIIAIGKIYFADNPKKVYYTLGSPYIKSDTKIYVPVDACNSMRLKLRVMSKPTYFKCIIMKCLPRMN